MRRVLFWVEDELHLYAKDITLYLITVTPDFLHSYPK
jgi:hypothetical protein